MAERITDTQDRVGSSYSGKWGRLDSIRGYLHVLRATESGRPAQDEERLQSGSIHPNRQKLEGPIGYLAVIPDRGDAANN